MTGFLFVVVLVAVNVYVVRALLRRRGRIVSARGFGTAADVGRLRSDVPRVRVQSLCVVGPDQAALTLRSMTHPDDSNRRGDEVDIEYRIAVNEGDPGYQILRGWLGQQSDLGVVLPPDSSLIRLRGIDDLQPLTLRLLGR